MSEELKMYVEYRDGKPHGYLYGPEWKQMELYMEGGYDTPEKAIEAWFKEQYVLPVRCRECELFSYDGRLPIKGRCSVIPAVHNGDQYCSYGVKKREK